MFKEMIETLKKNDLKIEKPWRIGWQGKIQLHEFLDNLLDYFEISDLRKIYDDREENYSLDPRTYILQESNDLCYLEHLLKEIRPFIPLIFMISQKRLFVRRLNESKLSEKSIINILKNFVNLRRTGRKKVFYDFEKKEFQEFKEKYSNVIAFHKIIDQFDGVTTGSILDHANALKEYKITKKQLEWFLIDFKKFKQDCSRATKYRFDKEYPSIEKSLHDIKFCKKNYEFWMDCLKKSTKE